MNERRLQILELLANGREQKQVSADLKLTRSNLDKELDRIRILLGAETTTHAVAIVVKRGLVSVEDVNTCKCGATMPLRTNPPNS